MKTDFKPWEEYPQFWKTESAFLSYIRGGIRRHLWAKNPVKLEFLKTARKRITNPVVKGRKAHPTVWGGVCEICNKEFATKDMEVDHKTGEYSLKKVEDIQSFVEGIVFVKMEDLALLCKPCHKAKTYSERSGMRLEDAVFEKQAIAICKLPVAHVRAWITENGEGNDFPAKTAPARRKQIVEILKRRK